MERDKKHFHHLLFYFYIYYLYLLFWFEKMAAKAHRFISEIYSTSDPVKT